MDHPYHQFWLIPSWWTNQEHGPVRIQSELTWEQAHGLDEEGKNPNHQPESKEWA